MVEYYDSKLCLYEYVSVHSVTFLVHWSTLKGKNYKMSIKSLKFFAFSFKNSIFLNSFERALLIACLLKFKTRAMPEGGNPIFVNKQTFSSVEVKGGVMR